MLNRLERKRKGKCILEWSNESLGTFERLKLALMTSPLLQYSVEKGIYTVLDTDPSHDCIGAVLSQVQNGEEKVIAYGFSHDKMRESLLCYKKETSVSLLLF